MDGSATGRLSRRAPRFVARPALSPFPHFYLGAKNVSRNSDFLENYLRKRPKEVETKGRVRYIALGWSCFSEDRVMD
jgi:hypothetical protein